VHRIGDYGKLWSVLNLFHPEMAYNKINADSLFINNITGIGIVPDIKISPTIKGIKENKDEVLERAISFASAGKRFCITVMSTLKLISAE
ncbi:MAG TPA: hypothetical protein VHZ50_02355, partial [Puia sp.]|nr:hypothetical protein [Puia sp.]